MSRDTLEQEPCEMTAEEYRQRMIQAFHNADTDELIAVCVLPTEKEFEHLEWLLKNHYKKEPCGNAIDRAEAIRIASGYCHPANVAKELAKLPPVTPQPRIGRWVLVEDMTDWFDATFECSCCKRAVIVPYDVRNEVYKEYPYCHCGAKMVEPQESEDKCKNCEYYRNPDYTRCHECKAESEDKE